MSKKKISSALISVYDKTGLEPIIHQLHKNDVSFYSTGGTEKFIKDLGIENIKEHESKILEYGIEKLKKNNSVQIVGEPQNRGSVMCFTMKGIHPHDIATILTKMVLL